jgi:hypothetical protein
MSTDDLPGRLPGSHSATELDSAPGDWDRPWPPVYKDVPPTELEKKMFGHDCERCPETGMIWEQGSGCLSKAEQTAVFKQQLNDPTWCRVYLTSDPSAATRHPKLLAFYKQRNPDWFEENLKWLHQPLQLAFLVNHPSPVHLPAKRILQAKPLRKSAGVCRC